jgi:hypothetical protein
MQLESAFDREPGQLLQVERLLAHPVSFAFA